MAIGIPLFPKFEKLSLKHKDFLRAIANNFPSSDFNFAGLFTWDVREVVQVSLLNSNLIIRSSDYLTHETFYSFIGENKVNETIQILTEYAKKRGEPTKLKLILESTVNKADSKLHKIEEDRNNYDYVLSVNEIAGLHGSKFQSKRKELNRFKRFHGDSMEAKELDLNKRKTIEDLENVIKNWKTSRNKKDDVIKDEFIAIKKALKHHKLLGIKAYGIYYLNNLIAFTLFEILPNKIAIIHFDKADVSYEGIYINLKHNLAKHLDKLGVEKMNYEQDLGIEGLRISKESYHPVEYIKKYTVERIN